MSCTKEMNHACCRDNNNPWPLFCLHSCLLPELAALQLQSCKESLPHNSNTNSSHKIDHDSMCNHTVTVSKYQINFVLSFPPSGYYDSFSITTTCVRLLFWLPPACLHVILSEGCRNYLSFQIVYNVTAACKSLSRLYAV